MESLFGIYDFPLVNDGKGHTMVISKTGLVVNPEDSEAYVVCYGMVDGTTSIYPAFRPTKKNLQVLLAALSIPTNSFNRTLDELLIGKTLTVSFGMDVSGKELLWLYGKMGATPIGEVTLKGE